jgi:pilus assembly protein Flp/PilA
MRDFLARFVKDEGGAAAVEYGLLVAAIAAIIILTVFYLGGYVEGAFKTTCKAFSSAGTISNTTTLTGC